MATCKECLHHEPCWEYGNILDPIHGGMICDSFKSYADVVPRRILFDLESKLHTMLPFKAHPILIDDKYMANSYEMGKEHVIYDILNYLAELEKKYTEANDAESN